MYEAGSLDPPPSIIPSSPVQCTYTHITHSTYCIHFITDYINNKKSNTVHSITLYC